MNRRTLITALAVMAFGFATVSTAEAGGGGGKTKKNAIYIVNAQAIAEPAQLVIWLPNSSTLATTGTYDQLIAAGAKYIGPGQTLKLFPNVAPGSGHVYVFPSQGVQLGTVVPGPDDSEPYTVKSGTTLGYTIAGVDGAATITPIAP